MHGYSHLISHTNATHLFVNCIPFLTILITKFLVDAQYQRIPNLNPLNYVSNQTGHQLKFIPVRRKIVFLSSGTLKTL
jgi:hypothetical protein